MFNEFREFIARGNVLDLAVGVIIGAAFGKIVTSLTDDVIMPVIGRLFGGLDFSDQYVVLSGAVAPGTSLEAARAAGANVLAWGSFISAIINFAILAWIIFLIVKAANKTLRKAPDAPAGPTDVDLLTEIRDELRKR
ncbi:MAG: large-conductance mechanosensitive channel protein [Sphingomonadales bacterium 32-68-7]|nr:MAG: large-conductance mechanosensitive channel protein [Sphingomonadales bacterium 12-68-11]OYX08554.1 MAG: large-conductance mechanosensitive channel protein [Sphingomonadales bacterium 32-68-7]